MKPNWYIISSIFLSGILLLILAVEIKGDYYKISTEEVHRISTREELLIHATELKKYAESPLIIHISDSIETDNSSDSDQEIYIMPSDLLKRKNRKLYATSPTLLVLSSEDIEISAKAWVVLSRKGYRNIKILDDTTNEIFNYSFQPDSIAGPK